MEKILSDTIKLDKKGTGVLMIAHRGLSGLETENTQCAFVAAGNRSYYGIETDVHFTKDGKYVISHDGNLSRVFGKNIEIKDYLYEDLRKVRKIEKGDTVEYMAVPTLREYFDVCRRYGKKSVLELKVEYTDEQLKEIIEIAKEEKQFENVVFISFFPDNMIRLRKILPNHPLQLLTGPINSVLGIDPMQSIGKFMGDPPRRYESAKGPCMMEGCIFEIDPETGKCLKAEAIRLK